MPESKASAAQTLIGQGYSTIFAIELLKQGYSPEEIKAKIEQERIVLPSICDVLIDFLVKKNISVETLATLSDMNPASIYKIMKRKRNPTRNAILRFAMAMALTIEETQTLLKSGNCALLSGGKERDLIIMEGLMHEQDYETVNETLKSKNLPELDGRG